MKNTTKKILSMLLAVIMLLSVMPVAYAQRPTYSPELEQYIDFWIKIESYRGNSYKSQSDEDEIFKILADVFNEHYSSEYDDFPPLGDTGIIWYEDIYNKNIDMDAISHFNQVGQIAINEIEAKIASGEIGVGINTYEFWKLYGGMFAYYDDVLIDDMFNGIQTTNSEFYQNLKAEMEEKDSLSPGNFANQTEYDAFIDNIFRPFCTMWFNCLDGNHPYGEYTSNGDATEESDGTKTATCEFCGATDTVIDEGSKLDNNDNSKCSCNCHKGGFMNLIWKILRFFYKLFGMNKTCSCGVAHY